MMAVYILWQAPSSTVGIGCSTKLSMIYQFFLYKKIEPSVVIITFQVPLMNGALPEVRVLDK